MGWTMAPGGGAPHMGSHGSNEAAKPEKALIMSFKDFSTSHHDAVSPPTGAAKAAPVKPAQAAQAVQAAKAAPAPKS